jgi:putative ATP-binding cassette transporter
VACSSTARDAVSQPPAAGRFLAARYWRTASGYWRATHAAAARLLTPVLLGSVVLQLVLQYRLNYWNRDFFDAFGRRDGAALWGQALLFLLLAGSSIVVAVLSIWARMMTQIRWRAWLTRHLIDRWLANDRFLQLHFLRGEDRNPEYRIAEDVRVATDAPVSMAAGLLTALLNVVIFVSILWNVGGDLVIEVPGHVLTVPKYLVITVVLYSALLTLAISIIVRRMVHVIAGKNAAEAQFRSTAASLRETGDVGLEADDAQGRHHRLSAAFDTLVGRYRELCLQFMRTTLVSHGNLLAAPIIGWVLCAPKYLVGTMSLGKAA